VVVALADLKFGVYDSYPPEGWYFFNYDNTELKRSSKIFFSVADQHRWTVC